MKILHVQKATGIGGSERHLLALLPELTTRGVEVRMCVLTGGDHSRFVDPLRSAGVDTVTIPSGPHLNPSLVRKIGKAIDDFAPDVVHTHLIHADLYGALAARKRRVPSVSTFHGTHPFYSRFPYRNVQRFATGMAACTICVSAHVERFVSGLHFAEPSKLRVVHHGIDAGEWSLSEERRDDERRSLGVRPGEVLIGVASRLFPNKGHDLLLEAFTKALTEEAGMRLLVAGDGPLRSELEAQAASLAGTNVGFLGYVDDVKSFMNACDIVVFPTLPGFGEGFGLALLEAMAARRPVVATAIDSMPEIVVDGVTGYLVPPGDVDAMSSALVTLARDGSLRRRVGDAGHERVVENFTFEKMVDATLAVYRDVGAERLQ